MLYCCWPFHSSKALRGSRLSGLRSRQTKASAAWVMILVTNTRNVHTVLTRNLTCVLRSWNSRSWSSNTALCWSLAPVYSWLGIGPELTHVVILWDYTIDQSFHNYAWSCSKSAASVFGDALIADAMPIQWDEASCKFCKSTRYLSTISDAHNYV